jgi:predicted nucleotidyltransferase
MANNTPSRQKFRLAKELAQRILKDPSLGFVDAVFVCGSVAANMAVPQSDIDLVVATTTKGFKDKPIIYRVCNEFHNQQNLRFNIHPIPFLTENVKAFIQGNLLVRNGTYNALLAQMLGNGAIPLFLRATAFPESEYNLGELKRRLAPRRTSIKKEYADIWIPSRTLEERMAANKKKAKRRFRTRN